MGKFWCKVRGHDWKEVYFPQIVRVEREFHMDTQTLMTIGKCKRCGHIDTVQAYGTFIHKFHPPTPAEILEEYLEDMKREEEEEDDK